MDIPSLAKETAAILIPVLPYLVEVGKGAAKKTGELATIATSESVKSLWSWLRLKADSYRPELLEAANDVALESDNTDAQATLRQQLRKMLEAQPDLKDELENLVKETSSQNNSVNVNASGAGAVAVGGHTIGTTITTNVNTKN